MAGLTPTRCCDSQGIECHFLEAWHQKLHTNTTPEDITVCEAYIAFLESGDIGTYSRVLWENGGISRADMADKWDRKIPGMQNPALQAPNRGDGVLQHSNSITAWPVAGLALSETAVIAVETYLNTEAYMP